jgi:hypothetical protein
MAKTPAGAFAEYAVRCDRRKRTRSSLIFSASALPAFDITPRIHGAFTSLSLI